LRPCLWPFWPSYWWTNRQFVYARL
jgi:hypothetical protein